MLKMGLSARAFRSVSILTVCLFYSASIHAQASSPSPSARQPRVSKPAVCSLLPNDLVANARLSFDEFDQRGTSPTTARQLGNRGCFVEAARATEHYMINGPLLTARQESAVTWHLGQYLAFAGQEQRAASVIAASRRPIDPTDELDWNSYVRGTWAFLVKDKTLLEKSLAQLRMAPIQDNASNAKALEKLLMCFGKTYRQAYLENCKIK